MNKHITLSLLTATILFHGCTWTQPKEPREATLVKNEEDKIVLQENSVVVKDKNQTDEERYKIAFEAPPLTQSLTTAKLAPNSNNVPVQKDETPLPQVTIEDSRPVSLSVEKIPVGKFAEVVLGSVLKLNYTITPEAAAKANQVSLNMASTSKASDFLALAQKIMNDNGLLLSKEATKDTIFVSLKPTKAPVGFDPNIKDTPIYYGRELTQSVADEKQITMFMPYYYVDMMQQFVHIKNLALSQSANFVIMDKHKVVMVRDLASNIRKALVYLDLFDRPVMKDKIAQIIPLRYVSPKNFVSRINDILPAVGVPIAEKSSQIGLFMQDLPEMNSLLVVSDKQEWVEQLLYWRSKLDSLTALGDTPQMFVYQVKNRKADELVKLAGGFGTSSQNSTDSKSKQSDTTKSTSNDTSKNNKKEDSSLGSSLFADTKIMADTNTNSLIVYATPERFREIEKIFQLIDTLPRQVMVEITIAELTLTDKLAYGLEWYLKNSGDKYSNTLQTLGGLGLGSSGLTGSILKNNGDFGAMISMFAQDNLINILSTPKLVVLDNQTATINVGTEVPVLSSQTSSSSIDTPSTSVQQSVQYRNTGVILSVTPTVNSGGVLTLKVNQSVSEAQQNTLSDISSPLILNRVIDTSVILRSGESVLLGGLMSENKSEGTTKVPFFGDIPLLGNFFKTTSNSTTKTELIMLVKPVILNSTAEHRELTQAINTLK